MGGLTRCHFVSKLTAAIESWQIASVNDYTVVLRHSDIFVRQIMLLYVELTPSTFEKGTAPELNILNFTRKPITYGRGKNLTRFNEDMIE